MLAERSPVLGIESSQLENQLNTNMLLMTSLYFITEEQ